MIIEVCIGEGSPHRYQVRRDGDRVVVCSIDDESSGPETVIDWRRPQPGIYSLLIDNASHEVFLEEEVGYLDVHLKQRSFRIRAADIRRHSAVVDAVAAADGVVRITAPIPGRVSRLLVRPGDPVERGDGIVVVEAMKMENELRAPRDGVVGTVEVEEGQGVEGGATLATIE